MRPTPGSVGQERQMKVRGGHDLLADEAGADQARKPDAEDGQRQACCDLIDGESEGQNAEDRRQGRAGENAAQRADQRRPRHIGAGEAAGRADDHHSLDAEIEHAGTLDHQLAGCGQQQRRRSRDDRQDDSFKQQHARASEACGPDGCGRRSGNRRRARRTARCPGRPWSDRAGPAKRSARPRRR